MCLFSKLKSKTHNSSLLDSREPEDPLESESFDMIFKPGFIRISLPFHASEEDVDFVIEAVKFVGKNGWKFLPFYKFSIQKGTFRFIEAEYMVSRNQFLRIPVCSVVISSP